MLESTPDQCSATVDEILALQNKVLSPFQTRILQSDLDLILSSCPAKREQILQSLFYSNKYHFASGLWDSWLNQYRGSVYYSTLCKSVNAYLVNREIQKSRENLGSLSKELKTPSETRASKTPSSQTPSEILNELTSLSEWYSLHPKLRDFITQHPFTENPQTFEYDGECESPQKSIDKLLSRDLAMRQSQLAVDPKLAPEIFPFQYSPFFHQNFALPSSFTHRPRWSSIISKGYVLKGVTRFRVWKLIKTKRNAAFYERLPKILILVGEIHANVQCKSSALPVINGGEYVMLLIEHYPDLLFDVYLERQFYEPFEHRVDLSKHPTLWIQSPLQSCVEAQHMDIVCPYSNVRVTNVNVRLPPASLIESLMRDDSDVKKNLSVKNSGVKENPITASVREQLAQMLHPEILLTRYPFRSKMDQLNVPERKLVSDLVKRLQREHKRTRVEEEFAENLKAQQEKKRTKLISVTLARHPFALTFPDWQDIYFLLSLLTGDGKANVGVGVFGSHHVRVLDKLLPELGYVDSINLQNSKGCVQVEEDYVDAMLSSLI